MADLSKVHDTLKKINEKIKDLLDNYDKLKYPEIRKNLDEIIDLKFDLLPNLPDVFGLPFISWYVALREIDHSVRDAQDETRDLPTDDDEVKRLIKRIKEQKELVERSIDKPKK